jgi:ATP-dependent Clp protease ATP-binding subunit ClpB
MSARNEDDVRAAVMAELDRAFRPEFLNRIDEVILFHNLSRENIQAIVDIQLRHLEQLLADRHIHIDLSTRAKAFLAEQGYDPIYGARPLKRVVQRELQDPLALAILEGRVMDGDTVLVDVDPGGTHVTFESGEPEPVLA